jgi:hypothetical protein
MALEREEGKGGCPTGRHYADKPNGMAKGINWGLAIGLGGRKALWGDNPAEIGTNWGQTNAKTTKWKELMSLA